MMLPFNAHLEINFWFYQPTETDVGTINFLIDSLLNMDDTLWLEKGVAEVRIQDENIVVIAWGTELVQLAEVLEWSLHQRIPHPTERRAKKRVDEFIFHILPDHPEVPRLRQHVNKVTLWHKLP